jgi:predicted ribosomally synthesized peptide with nif11-like leader
LPIHDRTSDQETLVSIEQARRFIERVHVDDEFRARVLAEADVDMRMALIRSEGFDCTAEEIAAALVALSTETLEGIFGGDTPSVYTSDPGWDIFHPN